jgi:prepilin-type N-terminal cleavage/methylation domain-containing protein
MKSRAGVTLIELVVVLMLLATIATLVGLRIPGPSDSPRHSRADRLYVARRRALGSGQQVVIWWNDSGGASAIALPDGSVISDSAVDVERFTGAVAQRVTAR